jgi:hypothetical protein
MKKVKDVLLVVFPIFSLSCGSPAAPSAITHPLGAATEAQKDLVSDDKSAFSIVDDLPLGRIVDGNLIPTARVQIGEKVALVGEEREALYEGRTIGLTHVQLSSGEDGWSRSLYIIPDAVLAVITDEQVPIYGAPMNGLTPKGTLSRMTVIAIARDSAASDFIRFSCFDTSTRAFHSGSYLKNRGLSSQIANVESAILYRLAQRSKDRAQKEAFLGSALKDFPDSAFAPILRDMQAEMTGSPHP